MALFQSVFSFNGRASRLEFWLVNASLLAAMIALYGGVALISVIFPETTAVLKASRGLASWKSLLTLYFIVWTVVFVLVQVRRYHDRGKSSWWCLLCLLPGIVYSVTGSDEISALILAAIILWQFVELGFLRGTPGSNAHGPAA